MESKPLLLVESPADLRDLPQTVIVSTASEEEPLYLEEEQATHQPAVSEVEDNTVENVNDTLLKQLQFLTKPFQQKVYQPLAIHLKDGQSIIGKIAAVEGNAVQIMTDGTILWMDCAEIEGLYWQGKPFPEHS